MYVYFSVHGWVYGYTVQMQASSTTHIYCLIRQYGSDSTCPTRNNYNSKKYTNNDWPRDAHFGISAVTHFFILLKFTGFWTFAQEVSAVKPCYTVTRCSAIFFRADFVLCDVVCIQVLLFMLATVSLRIKPVRQVLLAQDRLALMSQRTA